MMILHHKEIVLSRGLPKAGQTTSFFTGDDGTYQAGWWRGLTVSGNRQRWVYYERFGQKIVLDLATGLIWPRDGDDAGCCDGLCVEWELAITYANMSDFWGKTDWRIPNVKELLSLIHYGQSDEMWPNGVFYNMIGKEWWWTSNTYWYNTAYAYCVNSVTGAIQATISKMDDSVNLILVRGGI